MLASRRTVLVLLGAAFSAVVTRVRAAALEHKPFIDAAFRMKDEAVKAGDQPYGAVLVKEGRIIGFGPSRVVLKNDISAHAEREAIREAQARLGTSDLSGCILYSTSHPCSACEAASREAKIARMIYGADGADAGTRR
jgi:tRNA(Arg) A34 adenosine deaminase TadA